MKMAKASTADMEMAMKLCSALEAMDSRFFPDGAEGDNDPEDFDCDDDAHCGQALRHVLDILQGEYRQPLPHSYHSNSPGLHICCDSHCLKDRNRN